MYTPIWNVILSIFRTQNHFHSTENYLGSQKLTRYTFQMGVYILYSSEIWGVTGPYCHASVIFSGSESMCIFFYLKQENWNVFILFFAFLYWHVSKTANTIYKIAQRAQNMLVYIDYSDNAMWHSNIYNKIIIKIKVKILLFSNKRLYF